SANRRPRRGSLLDGEAGSENLRWSDRCRISWRNSYRSSEHHSGSHPFHEGRADRPTSDSSVSYASGRRGRRSRRHASRSKGFRKHWEVNGVDGERLASFAYPPRQPAPWSLGKKGCLG